MIVGTGARAVRLAGVLSRRGTTIVGAIDDSPQPALLHDCPDIPWLGGMDRLIDETVRRHVDQLYVAMPLRSGFDVWLRTQAAAQRLGVPATLEFDLGEIDARAHLVLDRNGTAALKCNQHPSQQGLQALLKRALDLAVSAMALAVLSPLLIVIGLWIRIDSPGPAIFRQDRVGLSRRRFQMFKFRTMAIGAEAMVADLPTIDPHGVMFKAEADPRVTRLGAWLRRTSLDELPQLINVLKGEMSLVGPRPMPVWVYDKVTVPDFHRRSSVKPGMTGLWQVTGRQQDLERMSARDLEYVDRWSLSVDVQVLLKTPAAVIGGEGAR